MSTSARFHSRALCGLAALAAVAVTAVGIADGVRTADRAAAAPSVNVTYADLDLSQPAGARQLYQRLQRASKAVCGSADQMNLAAYRRWQSCYSEALQRAVLRVNAPELRAPQAATRRNEIHADDLRGPLARFDQLRDARTELAAHARDQYSLAGHASS